MNTPNPADFFKSTQIGGKRYTIQALSGWEAFDGAAFISKIVAPVFGEVIDSRNVDQEIAMFEKQNTWREVLTIITHGINEPEMRVLVDKMLQGATCDGEVININEHFKESVHEMMELIMYAMEVNFKGFFTENGMLQSLMSRFKTVMTVTGAE